MSVRSYAEFAAGYQTTQSVQLYIGEIKSGVASMQTYYRVPVALVSLTTSNVQQIYVGCYVLHLSNPPVQEAPPFVPMGIRSAAIHQVTNNQDFLSLLLTTCA